MPIQPNSKYYDTLPTTSDALSHRLSHILRHHLLLLLLRRRSHFLLKRPVRHLQARQGRQAHVHNRQHHEDGHEAHENARREELVLLKERQPVRRVGRPPELARLRGFPSEFHVHRVDELGLVRLELVGVGKVDYRVVVVGLILLQELAELVVYDYPSARCPTRQVNEEKG